MSVNDNFTRENLDYYLKELAKEFRRRNRSQMPAEIVLVGGAAILANYHFRESTNDIDAIIAASSAMRDAIHAVGEKLNLDRDWINTDFLRTISYSSKLRTYSKYYCQYYGILEVRTINAEYLVAMKLVSFRRYKKDMSDIIGILDEQNKIGEPLTFEKINKAVFDLYEGWENISEYAKETLKIALQRKDLSEMLSDKLEEEIIGRNAVLERRVSVTEKSIDRIIEEALQHKQVENFKSSENNKDRKKYSR